MLPRMVEGDAVGSIYERKDQPVPALKPAAAPASPRETAGGPTRPRRIRLSSRSRYRSADASRRERRPSRRKRRKAVIFWFLVVGLAGVLGLAVYHARSGLFSGKTGFHGDELGRPPPLGVPTRPAESPLKPIPLP